MKGILAVSFVTCVALWSSPAFAARDVISAVRGTVQKLDASTRTVVVKAADGTEHTVYFVARTTVYGTEAAARDTFRGLQDGMDVIVHYTGKGANETALEIDKVSKDGLMAVKGTISRLDLATKRLVVKMADGTNETFVLTEHAAADAGEDIANRTESAARVTVYYTEIAGHKVAHYFEHA